MYICLTNSMEMKTVYITRKETFNAAHKLYKEEWSDDKNWEIFGKCSNKNWHGHNYTLFVTVKGIPNYETGFVINLKLLSQIIKKEIIAHLDHKNMNLDVDFLKEIIPSTENVIIRIWEQLKLPVEKVGGKLVRIKLIETENNFVEYYGGEQPF